MTPNRLFTIAAIVGFCVGWLVIASHYSHYFNIDHYSASVNGTPVTVTQPLSGARAVVVIAHGFAGSRQLMQTFALGLANNGFAAVTFDLPGHGQHPRPLTGSITEIEGATRTLVQATVEVIEAYRYHVNEGSLQAPVLPGVAIIGHSMASDIIIRVAQEQAGIRAVIAVSMSSPAVTADQPRNLLALVGDWEPGLKREALRAVGLATAPALAEPGMTYGSFARGTARKVSIVPMVEHIGILFSPIAVMETVRWLNQVFPGERESVAPWLGFWIAMVLVSGVALGRPLLSRLPRVARIEAGAGLGWRRLWLPIVVPMVATPLLLTVIPTRFLPVLVADYLVVHFAVYGLITAACLWWLGALQAMPRPSLRVAIAFAIAIVAVLAYAFLLLVLPIDSLVTNLIPGPGRAWLVGAMLAGTLPFFLAVEWATRGPGTGRFAYSAAKLAFVVSLALAVALDFQRLFFLVLIVPFIAIFLLVFGLISGWVHRATGHPAVSAVANAVFFAWAIAATFPLVAG